MTQLDPIGFPLLAVPDGGGRLAWPDLDASIQQSLQVLLQTRPGEQLMRPTFGIGLQEFLQQPDDVGTRRRIMEAVERGIRRWEPRVTLDAVDVTDGARIGWIRVEIRYRIRRTGAPRRLGLTLELESG